MLDSKNNHVDKEQSIVNIFTKATIKKKKKNQMLNDG